MTVRDFLVQNWGNLASVLGALLTIWFSLGARSAARQAKEASQTARSKLQSIDLFDELNRLNARIDDLLFRLDRGAWQIVSERATDLRVSLAAICGLNSHLMPDGVKERLMIAVTQFRNIAAGADRAIAPRKAPPDIARYKKIITDQKETLVLAMGQVKQKMGEQ